MISYRFIIKDNINQDIFQSMKDSCLGGITME
jgi:hypothetical protein